MREFVYYSRNAVTAGNLIRDDLKKAGRLDIVCNVIVSVFFISNQMRGDVRLHCVFDGGPNNPRHLVFESHPDMPISKKDVAGLIKKMLYKAPSTAGLVEIVPGAFIEKKGFEAVIKDLDKDGKNVLLLDKKGVDIRDHSLSGDEVFIIGDHDGFPVSMKKFLKKIDRVTVGPQTLFASQVVTLVHNEFDRNSY